jgi:hypothetical protein
MGRTFDGDVRPLEVAHKELLVEFGPLLRLPLQDLGVPELLLQCSGDGERSREH